MTFFKSSVNNERDLKIMKIALMMNIVECKWFYRTLRNYTARIKLKTHICRCQHKCVDYVLSLSLVFTIMHEIQKQEFFINYEKQIYILVNLSYFTVIL